MRNIEITRNTAETQIGLALNLDGSGKYQNDTGCGFLDHMLDLFSRHGRFDLAVTCKGDTEVDFHHTAEDIGIVLGDAFARALGDKKGINRYGSFLLPMDEALVLCAVDISGRACLSYEASIPSQKVGDFDTELVKEFFLAFTRSLGLTLHIRQLAGENSHHIIEAMFKGLGRAMAQAAAIDPRYADEIPSTKGVL
ncbi:imidazoleglycerol-phosphate dehydratase HisB [Bacilliculturomica massiliensis]|uniref:imidazoleglycerol-phosphate dehydratase HisB n=1 Tax=Bacilliculturomica massiliensis TaxID=1917867 RepID=UPI001031E927|nr:imidazoleglycerol-phosphate dehydratase HisB [Bacilliculturomica massiliensis]